MDPIYIATAWVSKGEIEGPNGEERDDSSRHILRGPAPDATRFVNACISLMRSQHGHAVTIDIGPISLSKRQPG